MKMSKIQPKRAPAARPVVPNWPSKKPGRPSGKKRDNNPPKVG